MPQRFQLKGFTLVEVIVVSIIVAILAGVAVPMFLGFLTNQRKETVKALAQSAAIQANILSRKGIDPVGNISALEQALFLPSPHPYVITVTSDSVFIEDSEHSTESNPIKSGAPY